MKDGNYSSVGYCKLDGPKTVVERGEEPVLFPEHEYERHGCEDPRVVLCDGTYYLFYVAYDGKNATGACATSKDLKNFKKMGIITAQITYDYAEDIFRQEQSKLKDRYFFFESYYKDIVGLDGLLSSLISPQTPHIYENYLVMITPATTTWCLYTQTVTLLTSCLTFAGSNLLFK